MDLRQLNAIVAIAEHGSFSAAADALATVQSNISTHVKKLEVELGTSLVDRATGELTEAGELVVARARRVIGELDAMSSDVTALSHEVIGTVRLGAIGTAARWLVPGLLDLVPLRHPHLHLVFIEATTLGLDSQLASGQVDIGVLALPASGTEVRTVPLFEEDLGLVLPSDHPLAAADRVSLADLARLPLLLPTRGSAYRDDLDALTRAAGVTLRPRAEMDSLRLIASLTFEGSGFSILPSGAMTPGLRERWTLVPVEGLAPRLVGFAQRRRGMPGAPVRAVLDILTEVVLDPGRTPPGVRPIPTEVGRARHEPPAVGLRPVAGVPSATASGRPPAPSPAP
ncbi:MAG TPA: LysR family transcriptional regulator [Acidimicrobiales bacterium]|nr:LysR family transcriptional regulator [Acidimicrobiales bacterium]